MDFEAPDPQGLYSSQARRKRFGFCPVGYWLFHAAGRDGYQGDPESWEFRLYCAKFTVPLAVWSKGIFRRALKEFYLPGTARRKASPAVLARSLLEREFLRLEHGEHRRDPKCAAAIWEVERGTVALDDAYGRLRGDLDGMTRLWESSGRAACLSGIAPEKFRNPGGDVLQLVLGGVTFLMAPELIWQDGGRLMVLDCTAYRIPEERRRAAEIFRAGALRRWSVAPDRVEYCFYEPSTGEECRDNGENAEDFTRMFRDLAGEAALWRDYLLAQEEAAREGRWLYPRPEQCSRCRFSGLCPAEKETNERRNGSNEI